MAEPRRGSSWTWSPPSRISPNRTQSFKMEPIQTQIVVVGGGPGGYTAAFYAADKGKKVILVERDPRLGGVCLNRACIPSKALRHAVKLIAETRESHVRGITFDPPRINLETLRAWK